jgi:hypothetical protein
VWWCGAGVCGGVCGGEGWEGGRGGRCRCVVDDAMARCGCGCGCGCGCHCGCGVWGVCGQVEASRS